MVRRGRRGESVDLTEMERTHIGESRADDRSTVVVDGYERPHSVRVGPGADDWEYRVGRSWIHMDRALKRLAELKTKPTAGLRGLYYPGATPAGAPLWQSILYFDETFVIHPGASLADGRNLQPLHDQMRAWEELDDEEVGARLRETFGENRSSKALEFIGRLREFDRASLEFKRADVLRAIPPQMQKRPGFLELLMADVEDPEFAAVVESGWREPAFIASLKMEFYEERGRGLAAGPRRS